MVLRHELRLTSVPCVPTPINLHQRTDDLPSVMSTKLCTFYAYPNKIAIISRRTMQLYFIRAPPSNTKNCYTLSNPSTPRQCVKSVKLVVVLHSFLHLLELRIHPLRDVLQLRFGHRRALHERHITLYIHVHARLHELTHRDPPS